MLSSKVGLALSLSCVVPSPLLDGIKVTFQRACIQRKLIAVSSASSIRSHHCINRCQADDSTYCSAVQAKQKSFDYNFQTTTTNVMKWSKGQSSYFKQNISVRFFSVDSVSEKRAVNDYLDAEDANIFNILNEDMTVIPDFITEEEEQSLLGEVDRYMKRLRYEYDHWDNAIHGYRETEKKSWNEANQAILNRVKSLAFHSGVSPLAYVHVLDISKDGYIKPHVDAVRFCGDTIAGLCLLSSCVMRLVLEKDLSKYGDFYLPQRSLYIMKGKARYDFTHEVLKESESKFKGKVVPRDRRISIMCRNEPRPEDTR